MKYYIKLIVGFRRDQEHTIPASEAHKAYYLFNNPDVRTIFLNGLAIKGDQIQEIVPDYHATMGWNPTHILDNDDHNELTLNGVKLKMQFIMAEAKEIGARGNPEELQIPLNKLIEGKTPQVLKEYKGTQSIKQLLEKATPTLPTQQPTYKV